MLADVGLVVFIGSGIVVVISGNIAWGIFICEINPTLRKMGHQFDTTGRGLPHDWKKALELYEQKCLAEGVTLMWWRYFWISYSVCILAIIVAGFDVVWKCVANK